VSSQLLRALEDSFQILLGILQKYSSNFRTPLKKTEAQRFLKVLSLLFFFQTMDNLVQMKVLDTLDEIMPMIFNAHFTGM
jgi:hypothetical protein